MEKLLSTFRVRTQIWFVGMIGAFGLLMVTATWFVGSSSETRVLGIMEHATLAKNLSADINIGILDARRREKDFLLRRKEESLQRHAALIKTVLQKTDEIVVALSDGDDRAAVQALKAGLVRYGQQFAEVVEVQRKIGFTESGGLLGALRTSVHHVEAQLADTSESRLTILMLQMRRHEKDFLARLDGKYVESFKLRVIEFATALDASALSPEMRKQISADMVVYEGDFLALADASLSQLSAISALTSLYATIEPVMAAISQSIDRNYTAADEEARLIHEHATNMMVLFIILGLTLSAVGSWMVARGIYVPLGRIVAVMRRLAGGERGVALPEASRRDETGDIARALCVFQDNLIEGERAVAAQQALQAGRARRHEVIESAIASFETQAAQAIQDVANDAEQMRQRAVSLAAIAEQTTHRANGIAAAALEASANVDTLARAAEELTSSIGEIGRQVRDSSRIATTAVNEADQTNTTVSGLVDASSRIGDVVQMINGIASQTNLLALNATIEAARAGDAGKGFAVVATEVKNLSGQTAKATDEITQQINEMQVVAGGAAQAITGIGGTISEIFAVVTSISSAVDQQSAATQEIARNIHDTSDGTAAVTRAIDGVSVAARETSTIASEVLASANHVRERTDIVLKVIANFIGHVRTA